MSRTRVLQRRLRTLATLREAVGALRSLSAQHFRAARAPLAGARAYRDEIGAFLGALDGPGAPPPPSAPVGIVLVAADLGLVGQYSARLVREALALRDEAGDGPLICLGRRALAPLAQAGVRPVAVQPAPTSVAGLPTLLLPLVDTLLGLRRDGELSSLWLVAARFDGVGAYTPVRVPVLPVAAPAGLATLAPSPYCAREQLASVVVREHLYAALYETMLEALASEHGQRLVIAESARAWIDERMAATRRLVSSRRRESSTQEVLEVASASRASQRDGRAQP